MTVVAFDQLKSEPAISLAGGKGTTLARLFQAGYPVPDGLIVLPTAFVDDELTTEAWGELREKSKALAAGSMTDSRFAIRSSALSEDSAQASFAGEFETVLGVRGDSEIRSAIQTVRRSRRLERVYAYSEARGLALHHDVAIVVQRMVPSELSGVLFTADPISGSYRNMVGNYVKGTGERLVSGETDGETFRLNRPKGRYEGPPELKRYGRKLYKLARRLEDELGGPQDIEFAIAVGRIHLLQARPITTLQGYNPLRGEWNDSLRGDYLWINTNFGEALPDVMTPYTWSIFQLYFDEVFPFRLPGNHPLAGNIGGRFYFNISLFASLIASLKLEPRKVLERDETFGRIPEDVEIPIQPFSFSEIVRTILPLFLRARRRVLLLRKGIPAFLDHAQQLTMEIRGRIQSAGSTADLAAIWNVSMAPHARYVSRMLHASVSQLQDSSGKLRGQLVKLVGEADTETLLSGVGDLESLGPLLGLAKLAQGEMTRQEYVERYGHRGPHEAELSEPRPAEDPTWIDQQLAHMRESDPGHVIDVESMLAKQRQEREAAWDRLSAQYPRRAHAIRRRLDQVATASRIRERVRSEATRMLWAGRDFALKAGELTGLGDDVFFLGADEIIALLGGDQSYLACIPIRKEAYIRFRALPPYPTIIRGRFDPLKWAEDPTRRSHIIDGREDQQEPPGLTCITGFPGAGGVVEGTVRRLDSPNEGNQLQRGEVLVTNTTNIGWTPLFPRAAAIVTDVGAPLSHAAIVARELGIPAVVGCGDATMHLKNGCRVRVNGSRGTVELLEIGYRANGF